VGQVDRQDAAYAAGRLCASKRLRDRQIWWSRFVLEKECLVKVHLVFFLVDVLMFLGYCFALFLQLLQRAFGLRIKI
jgi:hypothetical protein